MATGAADGDGALTVCVFASSSPTTPPEFMDAAARLGALIGERGHVCINGGGRLGGMGALNTAITTVGGRPPIGVIHSRWVIDGAEFGQAGAMEIVHGDDLAERKRALRAKADAIIALPGGWGTLDELCEVIALRQLGMYTKPVCLVNIAGYYDPLVALMEGMERQGIQKVSSAVLVEVCTDASAALDFVERAVAEAARGTTAIADEAKMARARDQSRGPGGGSTPARRHWGALAVVVAACATLGMASARSAPG